MKTAAKFLSGFRVKVLSSDSREGKIQTPVRKDSTGWGEEEKNKKKGQSFAKLNEEGSLAKTWQNYSGMWMSSNYCLDLHFFIDNILRVQENLKWKVAHVSNSSFTLNCIICAQPPLSFCSLCKSSTHLWFLAHRLWCCQSVTLKPYLYLA